MRPLLGVVSLVLLFELLTANFPNSFSILLGVVLLLIVYALPQGVAGLLSRSLAVLCRRGREIHMRKMWSVPGLGLPRRSAALAGVGAKAGQIARLGIARIVQLVRVLGSISCVYNVVAGMAFRAKPLFGEPARGAAHALLARIGLADKADASASELTYIDHSRLELARALALDPELLLLDEWLAGLNPSELKSGIAVIKSLRDEGLTIPIVEHVMDAIRAPCDRCVVMSAGRKIAEGPPAAVLSDREVVRAYLGESHA